LRHQVDMLQAKIQIQEEERAQMIQSLRGMKDKIGGIERHYGIEILNKLQELRIEVANKVEGGAGGGSRENKQEEEWGSIEAIA
jgi:hypothetical protein